MRLNRFLAAAGFGSRRSCDELIASGAVSINGHAIEKLATLVAEGDDVRVNGRIAKASRPVYLLMNKPKGVVVTRADERGRRTVFDLLPPNYAGLFHVGRLDKESEGLLILTNDGELAQHLTHPAHEVDKEYEVTIDKPFDAADAAKMLKGIFIEGGRARFEHIRSTGLNRLKVILRQGIKRQIRLMFYDRGYEVVRLVRTRIGSIKDPQMPSGTYRLLTGEEVQSLQKTKSLRKPERPARPARAKPGVRPRKGPAGRAPRTFSS